MECVCGGFIIHILLPVLSKGQVDGVVGGSDSQGHSLCKPSLPPQCTAWYLTCACVVHTMMYATLPACSTATDLVLGLGPLSMDVQFQCM